MGHLTIEQSHALLKSTQGLHLCWEIKQCQGMHPGVGAVQVLAEPQGSFPQGQLALSQRLPRHCSIGDHAALDEILTLWTGPAQGAWCYSHSWILVLFV